MLQRFYSPKQTKVAFENDEKVKFLIFSRYTGYFRDHQFHISELF